MKRIICFFAGHRPGTCEQAYDECFSLFPILLASTCTRCKRRIMIHPPTTSWHLRDWKYKSEVDGVHLGGWKLKARCENCANYCPLPDEVKEVLKKTIANAFDKIDDDDDLSGLKVLQNLGQADGQCRGDLPKSGCNEWPMVTKDAWCAKFRSAPPLP